ncbi:MAG: hypothetical protein R3358_05985 [Woeseiaceae bacterium]|nr:hypothetical protein [Woeseiaceae bacterium]
MNWDAVSAVAEVVGVIAVVVSLIYLAVQVKQNTNQLRQENMYTLVRGTLDTNWYYHRDPVAFEVFERGVRSYDDLSPQEQAHFHSIVVDLSFYLELVRQLCRAGLIDKSALDVNLRFMLAILNTPGGRQWWALAQHTKPMPEEQIEFLQAALDSATDIPPITELQPWFGHATR